MDMLYSFPMIFSSAQDLPWLCFEVLEATGNFREDALVGGGYYFPD
jgi:hypothetical protein